MAALTLPAVPKPQLEVIFDKATHSVWVDNHEHAPYTLDFSFPRFENTSVNCSQPCTLVAPAYQKTQILQFKRQQPGTAWHYSYKYHFRIGDFRSQPLLKFPYQLPYASGRAFTIGQGYKGGFTHTGEHAFALDFHMPDGTPVHVAREGQAVWVVNHFRAGGISEAFKQRANTLIVLHADGSMARYGHFRYQGIVVKNGQYIRNGQLVGYSGNTGYSSRPHLHFEVFRTVNGQQLKSLPTVFQTTKGLQVLKSKATYQRPD